MFSLSHDDFLSYISETSKPIHVEINDQRIKSYTEKFWNALNKNTKSTELYFKYGYYMDEISSDDYMNGFRIPTTIKTLGLPCINKDVSKKYILPSHISNLELHNLDTLHEIDFSQNHDLQNIIINHTYYNSSTIFSPSHDLSHMYSLKFIFKINCIKNGNNVNNCDSYESSVNEIMKNYKLPYGCQFVFEYKNNKENEKHI